MHPGRPERSLSERLDLDPPLVAGSEARIRKPHVWVDRGQDLPAPGIVLRQARSAEDNAWLVKVAWARQDPMRLNETDLHVEWVDASRVKPA